MTTLSTPALVTFGLYLLAMLAIGIYFYRRTNTLGDFILGGRGLNSPTAALSAHASDMSGWLLLGLPGWAYASGLDAVWMIVGLGVGIYLAWKLIAARLRVSTYEADDALTLSAYFEHRFADRTRLLRLTSAVIILVFFTLYVASGLVAGGLLFGQVFGVDATTAVTASVVVIVAYAFLGGFLAVSLTDVVQGTLMFVALVAVPLAVVATLGGWTPLTDGLAAREPALLSLGQEVAYADGGWSVGGTFGVVAIISSLAWGLGYFGQPHILARFMSIRTPELVRPARRIGMTWAVVTMTGAMLVGLAGVAFFDTPLDDPETVFLTLVSALMNPWVGGVILAAVLAAIMSTADSQLLVASSALTEDLYRAFLHRDASQAVLVWVGRATVVGVAVVAYALALQGGGVLELVAYAWAGFGASFGPLIILSLYWPRMTRAGAAAGMVVGALTVLLWSRIDPFDGLYEMVPGFALSALAIVVVSLVTRSSLPPAAIEPMEAAARADA